MKDLPNIYDWNKPYDIFAVLDTNICRNKYGIKYVTSASEKMLLFKIAERYVLPNRNNNDLVKYIGNGKWKIKNGLER